MIVERLPIKITANPAHVALRYLSGLHPERYRRLVARFERLSDAEVEALWAEVRENFSRRHRNFEEQLLRHIRRLEIQLGHKLDLTEQQRLLLGTYLTREYALEGAGFFSPSIVIHPSQAEVPTGRLRFLMSIRTTGEGHFSSLCFWQGTLDRDGNVYPEEPSQWRTPGRRLGRSYSHAFLRSRLSYWQNFDPGVIRLLPDPFTLEDAFGMQDSPFREVVLEMIDNNYDLVFAEETALDERVILPLASSEASGMEDVRLTRLEETDGPSYLGTYTAYDGNRIQSKLLSTRDFMKINIRSLYGREVKDKGMALFPRRIDGRYAMISRQDGEGLSLMYSDDLLFWNERKAVLSPTHSWALAQIGNCGSPIETEAGWLLLTHGVGPMNRHCLGVSLLDRDDPGQVIASLSEPLLTPIAAEREGYEPNRLYSCGWLEYGDFLLIPYSMSDVACGFARVRTVALIDKLRK